MPLPKKPREKSPTPTWDFNLEGIEKDFDKLVDKYHDTNVADNTVVLSKVNKMPENGFYLMLVTKKNNKIAMRQFGSDISPDTLVKSFVSIINSFNVDPIDPSIGRG